MDIETNNEGMDVDTPGTLMGSALQIDAELAAQAHALSIADPNLGAEEAQHLDEDGAHQELASTVTQYSRSSLIQEGCNETVRGNAELTTKVNDMSQ